MSVRSFIATISQHDGLNFMLTNRIPRRLATRFMGWFSRIEQPLVRDLSIRTWQLFCDLDLREAKKSRFTSLRDCFIRELKEGARPLDPEPSSIVSPCDGIVGACGTVENGKLFQVKGSAYPLAELLGDKQLAESYRGGPYVTLRLTAGMYHRFHAPQDCRVDAVTHLWGDTWNVNPPTLARVKKLYCRNERAVIQTRLEPGGERLILVAVAAVLVAGIRLRFLDLVVDPRRSAGSMPVPGKNRLRRGQEMGWFEHGSTIIVLGDRGLSIANAITTGSTVRMGEALLRRERR
ncbi:MAG: phosphatidylserine decarboxylase [Rhodospirillales bacterium]|nr:phosphatidylserine decarboxylase [Acetobacter sp.]